MHIETLERRRHSISLTPLIDVVFILLVFFMLATSFTDWRPITLATGTSDAAPGETPPAVVYVDADGTLRFRGQSQSPRALAATLNEALANERFSAVIIQPRPEATLDVTVAALDALSAAGVTPMSLTTRGVDASP